MERNVRRESAADRDGQVKGFGSPTTRRRLAEVGTLLLGEVYYAKVRGEVHLPPNNDDLVGYRNKEDG